MHPDYLQVSAMETFQVKSTLVSFQDGRHKTYPHLQKSSPSSTPAEPTLNQESTGSVEQQIF